MVAFAKNKNKKDYCLTFIHCWTCLTRRQHGIRKYCITCLNLVCIGICSCISILLSIIIFKKFSFQMVRAEGVSQVTGRLPSNLMTYYYGHFALFVMEAGGIRVLFNNNSSFAIKSIKCYGKKLDFNIKLLIQVSKFWRYLHFKTNQIDRSLDSITAFLEAEDLEGGN